MRADLIRLTVMAAIAAFLAIAAFPQDSESPSSRGRILFAGSGCTGCHSLDGVATEARIGPDLTGLASRAGDRVEGLGAPEYVAESIRNPASFIVPGFSPMMPDLRLSDEEIEALVDFLLGRDGRI